MGNISVCIATYNGEKFIKEQLDSILIQLNFDDEIIISDDSSTDRTIEIIESYNENRIKLLKNNTFCNPIFNIENALKLVKGDYIFLADQDDIWFATKVQTMLKYFEKYDMIVSDCVVMDEKGGVIYESFFELNKSKSGFANNLLRNGYIGCCMALKRKVLEKSIPFPKDIPLHDLWLGFIAEVFFEPIFIKEKLIYYRRHQNAFSYTGGKSKFSFLKKISFRINCLKYLPLLILKK
jgi:glycosyltransferase involved in cell wall biosynthesis